MKKLISGMLLSVTMLGFNACSSDDNDAAPTPSANGTMTAKVDGVNWSAMSGRAAGSIISNVSNLSGVASDSSFITITINQTIVSGATYDLGPAGGNAGAIAPSTNGMAAAWTSNSHPSCTGQLKVTSMDATNKKMSGTFSFKAWRATDNTFKDITAGVFTNVTYATSVSGGGSNTFTVKIDNVTFTPALIAGSKALGKITVTASDSQGAKSVGIGMPDNVAPGTYNLTAFGTYYGQYNVNASTFTMSSSGTLVVTSHNTTTKKVIGTFSFVSEPITGGPPTYNLTNGSFSVTYQ